MRPVTRVGLRVSPGARRNEIVGRYGERWKVRVAAAAERGRANDAVLELVASTLGVPQDRVKLVAGATARDKVVEVSGLTAAEAERLLVGGTERGRGP